MPDWGDMISRMPGHKKLPNGVTVLAEYGREQTHQILYNLILK
jgi:hypothetical protein